MAKAEKQYIKIRGANEHNLKNLDVDIDRKSTRLNSSHP